MVVIWVVEPCNLRHRGIIVQDSVFPRDFLIFCQAPAEDAEDTDDGEIVVIPVCCLVGLASGDRKNPSYEVIKVSDLEILGNSQEREVHGWLKKKRALCGNLPRKRKT